MNQLPLPQELSRSNLAERAWIARVRAGDRTAMAAMFDTYYAPLVAFAVRMTGSQDAAEDVVQDVFVRIWELRHDWHVTSRLAAYLCGSVRNGAMRETRHREVRERLAQWVPPMTAAPDPDGATRSTEIDAAVAAAIADLPTRCRAVYALRWYDQLTYPEIAHILGITIKAVEAQVTAALKRLRPKLDHLV